MDSSTKYQSRVIWSLPLDKSRIHVIVLRVFCLVVSLPHLSNVTVKLGVQLRSKLKMSFITVGSLLKLSFTMVRSHVELTIRTVLCEAVVL